MLGYSVGHFLVDQTFRVIMVLTVLRLVHSWGYNFSVEATQR